MASYKRAKAPSPRPTKPKTGAKALAAPVKAGIPVLVPVEPVPLAVVVVPLVLAVVGNAEVVVGLAVEEVPVEVVDALVDDVVTTVEVVVVLTDEVLVVLAVDVEVVAASIAGTAAKGPLANGVSDGHTNTVSVTVWTESAESGEML